MDPFLDRISADREKFSVASGNDFKYENRTVRVLEILSVRQALVSDLKTNVLITADIDKLRPLETPTNDDSGTLSNAVRDPASFSTREWEEAQRRFAIIRPLLALKARTTADVQDAADKNDLSRALIYRMLRTYEDNQSIGSLLPRKRGPKFRSYKLHPIVEAIVRKHIEEGYKSEQKLNVSAVQERIRNDCLVRGLSVPAINTVHLRIKHGNPEEYMSAREGADKAKNKFKPIQSGVPGAEHPLEFAQVDHTRADIIVVDEVHRLPIGRPWITLVIDVSTRVALGIYISLEAPSYTSVGAALSNAFLPKYDYLAKLDLNVEWPVWGIPSKIAADNGADFRSNYLERAVDDYNFIMEWRPLDDTHFGGHIERWMNTFANWTKTLPGTTFASVAERGTYDSENQSAMTLYEFEQYVVRRLCEVYHKSEHRGLKNKLSPLRAWEQGVLGTPQKKGIGIPPRFGNAEKVRIDFLPHFERIIDRSGITFENIPYQADILRERLESMLPNTSREERKTLFRRDPRDISYVWMWDAQTENYFPIPLAERSLPAMSHGEYKAQERMLKNRNEPYNPVAIAEHNLANNALVEQAKKQTKTSRKQAERRKVNLRKAVKPTTTAEVNTPVASQLAAFGDEGGLLSDDILPFDEEEEL